MVYFFISFVIVIQGLLFLLHYFIYRSTVRFFSIANPSAILYLKIIFAFLSVNFVISELLSFRYDNTFIKYLVIFANLWLCLFYFLLLACLIMYLFNLTATRLNFNYNQPAVFGALIFLALVATLYGVLHADKVKVAELTIGLPNLPSEWQDKTAVFISDTHLGKINDYNFGKNVAKKIGELNPDIVLIGGDLFDGAEPNLNQLIEPFSELKPQFGTYFITGNHEEFSNKQKFLTIVSNAGIRVLDNDKIDMGGLQLIGVDYSDSGDKERFASILERLRINKNNPSILLKHSPSYPEVAQKSGINLQLSGHTHRGQVFPINFITSAIYGGYDFGLKKFKNMLIYTSSGAGTWGPPMRLGSNLEIVFIKLVKN